MSRGTVKEHEDDKDKSSEGEIDIEAPAVVY